MSVLGAHRTLTPRQSYSVIPSDDGVSMGREARLVQRRPEIKHVHSALLDMDVLRLVHSAMKQAAEKQQLPVHIGSPTEKQSWLAPRNIMPTIPISMVRTAATPQSGTMATSTIFTTDTFTTCTKIMLTNTQ
jgi:hypothetical protein